jgi:hypothetical protein
LKKSSNTHRGAHDEHDGPLSKKKALQSAIYVLDVKVVEVREIEKS